MAAGDAARLAFAKASVRWRSKDRAGLCPLKMNFEQTCARACVLAMACLINDDDDDDDDDDDGDDFVFHEQARPNYTLCVKFGYLCS